MSESEEPQHGGLVAGRVVRVGDTIRRPAGAWTPTVQALLAYVRTKDFPAPKPLGLDDRGREVVSYLPGHAGSWPWPEALRATEGARAVGALLRRYHDAVVDFVPSSPVWQHGEQALAPGEIALHGDFAPHNLLWEGDRLSGVIDFELARPGHPLEDAAYCVIRTAHLRPDAFAKNLGYSEVPDRRARFDAFAQGYDITRGELLAAVVKGQQDEIDRMLRYGTIGMEPWADFLRHGLEARAREELAWLEANIGSLA